MTALPTGLASCRVVELPTVADGRGSLTFTQAESGLDFPVRRAYWLHGVPAGASRGAHAHRSLEQLMLAPSGSFEVHLDDGHATRTVPLDRPTIGLRIGPMVWRELRAFSPGAVCLVLASRPYQESDYIRDHAAFLREARAAGRDAG